MNKIHEKNKEFVLTYNKSFGNMSLVPVNKIKKSRKKAEKKQKKMLTGIMRHDILLDVAARSGRHKNLENYTVQKVSQFKKESKGTKVS